MKYLILFTLLSSIIFMSKTAELLVFGHRGAAGLQAENTLSSFKKAINLGVSMIEFDVQKCASGQLIVMHDKSIDRTTNGTGLVADLTLNQLKNVKTTNDEIIPTLQEALDCIDKQVNVNIEIKCQDIEEDLVEIIEDYVENKGWHYHNFLISSFDHHQLQKVKELNAKINVGALIGGIPIDYAACAQKIGAFSIHVWKEFITQDYIDDAHSRGIKFFIFVVNDPQEAKFFSALGVDGIFTDYPDLL